MSEHPNVKVFQRLYDAFTTGNMVKVGEEFSDDLVWHVPGSNSISGDYEGRELTLQLFGKMFEATSGTYSPRVLDILANDKHVAAYLHATGSRNGQTLDQDYIFMFRIENGKIAEVWEFWNDGPAWGKFWS